MRPPLLIVRASLSAFLQQTSPLLTLYASQPVCAVVSRKAVSAASECTSSADMAVRKMYDTPFWEDGDPDKICNRLPWQLFTSWCDIICYQNSYIRSLAWMKEDCRDACIV